MWLLIAVSIDRYYDDKKIPFFNKYKKGIFFRGERMEKLKLIPQAKFENKIK